MYQFTTTNVINSAYALDYEGNQLLDSSGVAVPKYSGSTTALWVAKVNTFKVANIVSISKRPYTAGVKEVGTITIPTMTGDSVVRLTVDVKLSQSTQSEYVNYSLDFKLPVIVEVISSGVAATDAAALIVQLNSLKNRFGHRYFSAASGGGAVINITANDYTQRFNSIIVAEETANTNSVVQFDYITKATGSISTAGKVGFGDDNWMLRSVMIPTAENVRIFGISKDERPVMGGNYTEYVLRYSIVKDGTDGIVSGGTSVTTHVFYVKSDLVTSFEAAITTTGIAVNTIGTVVTDVAIATASVTTAATAGGVQLVATTTPAGATNVVYALRSAGNIDASGTGADFTKVSITNSGLMKFASGHGIVATDTIGLTVTVDGFTKATTVVMTA